MRNMLYRCHAFYAWNTFYVRNTFYARNAFFAPSAFYVLRQTLYVRNAFYARNHFYAGNAFYERNAFYARNPFYARNAFYSLNRHIFYTVSKYMCIFSWWNLEPPYSLYSWRENLFLSIHFGAFLVQAADRPIHWSLYFGFIDTIPQISLSFTTISVNSSQKISCWKLPEFKKVLSFLVTTQFSLFEVTYCYFHNIIDET